MFASVQQWSGTVDERFRELTRQLGEKFAALDAAMAGQASVEVLQRLERLEEKHSSATRAHAQRLQALENHVDDVVTRVAAVEDVAR